MKKKSHFKEFIDILLALYKAYPKDNIGKHFSMAFADYPDLWTVSDKELVHALEKYQLTLELDYQVVSDEYVKQIEEDAAHLFDASEEEEE